MKREEFEQLKPKIQEFVELGVTLGWFRQKSLNRVLMVR